MLLFPLYITKDLLECISSVFYLAVFNLHQKKASSFIITFASTLSVNLSTETPGTTKRTGNYHFHDSFHI
ncbi:MAG: hypothetical protein C4584_00755 [Armatimonadetes bacterium]|nr:MAG: hypothetical protein C4584_00755 [Armatimonadota bacterium]